MYEIYCKSFCDSNGDGIGDLQGVISKLPMLQELGINCIWFTPIFTSPQVDNGYDVADYQNIDPAYGTLDDFKELLLKAHALGIRILLDMVLNHSSDEHRWFLESRKSKDNPYRNYYIWQPPKTDGSEPNNWGNYFLEGNGSAWTFDKATGEYYLHQYSAKMPDLNWEYVPLREEVYRMMRWWLDMGVDGFRFDIFTRFKKPAGFPDTPKSPNALLDRNGFIVDRDMCTCVDGIHEIWQNIHKNVMEGRDIFTIGEGSGINIQNVADYTAQSRKELDTVYHFNLVSRKRPPFTLQQFRTEQTQWAEVMKKDVWTTQYLSNHDQPRMVSRYGSDGQFRVESAKLLAVLVHTMPGTPFLYQGEEIGMTNVAYSCIENYNDRYTVGEYYSMLENGMEAEQALAILQPKSRDNTRTPYQWNASRHAGFTTGTPWLKVNENYPSVNYEADQKSSDSIFAFYQQLIRMRKDHPAIIGGNLEFVLPDHENVLMYLRRYEQETLLIIANKSDCEVPVQVPPELIGKVFRRLLSNRPETVPSLGGRSAWLPWEAEIYCVENP